MIYQSRENFMFIQCYLFSVGLYVYVHNLCVYKLYINCLCIPFFGYSTLISSQFCKDWFIFWKSACKFDMFTVFFFKFIFIDFYMAWPSFRDCTIIDFIYCSDFTRNVCVVNKKLDICLLLSLMMNWKMVMSHGVMNIAYYDLWRLSVGIPYCKYVWHAVLCFMNKLCR